MSAIADPSVSEPSSSAARVWNARLYSTTGGQKVTILGSEPTVAQAVSKLVEIARTASRSIQHLALDIIGFLRGFEAFDEAASTLARASQCEQEQEDHEHDGAVAHR